MSSRPAPPFTPLSTAALLGQVMDQLPYRVLLKDTRSLFIACNRLLADDLALSPAELVGKCDADFFPAELAQRYRDDDLRVMASGTTQRHEEPYLKGGEARWLSTTKFPLFDELGQVVGVGVFFDDITEKKQQQERLQQYTWTLEAIGRAHHAMLRPDDEQTLLQEICDAITFDGRFPLVTVLQEKPDQHTLQVLAQAGNATWFASDEWLTRDPALHQAISTEMPCNEALPCELVHHSATLRARLLLPLQWHTGGRGGCSFTASRPAPSPTRRCTSSASWRTTLPMACRPGRLSRPTSPPSATRCCMPVSWSWRWKMPSVPLPPCWSSAIPTPPATRSTSPPWRWP
ncbi:PAS domain-containing protein [Aeromonas dhakensis]